MALDSLNLAQSRKLRICWNRRKSLKSFVNFLFLKIFFLFFSAKFISTINMRRFWTIALIDTQWGMAPAAAVGMIRVRLIQAAAAVADLAARGGAGHRQATENGFAGRYLF